MLLLLIAPAASCPIQLPSRRFDCSSTPKTGLIRFDWFGC